MFDAWQALFGVNGVNRRREERHLVCWSGLGSEMILSVRA